MPDDPYAAIATPVDDPYSTIATPIQAKPPTLAQVLAQDRDKTDKEYLNYRGAAGVAGATIHGLNNVGRDTIGAIKGAWDMLTAPPQDKSETAIGLAGPVALPLYRTLKQLGHSASDATQIVGAIHDINQSPDPMGYYMNAAEDTASQGAGQDLVALVTEGFSNSLPKIGSAVGDALHKNLPQRAAIPEAANMSPSAIEGTEKVFRAAAPVGSDPGFRENVYAAAGDLADIGRKIDLKDAKGGIINPDMRVRATVDAVNEHLSDMYKTERQPQISRNSDAPIQLDLDADAQSGLKFLSRRAGQSATRSLAQNTLDNPSSTVANVDQLAKTVNKELLGFQSMTPAERSANVATSQRYAGLKALDQQLSDHLNTTLENRGETGVGDYERRYAGLSSVRDRLQQQMNAAELNQPGIVKGLVRPVVSAATGGIKSGLGQAMVADVNPGRMLQQGLKSLADSELQPSRSGIFPPNRNASIPGQVAVKGLLPAPSIQLGSEMEPIGQSSEPPPVDATTRAQRKGLLLPQQAGGRIVTPQYGYSTPAGSEVGAPGEQRIGVQATQIIEPPDRLNNVKGKPFFASTAGPQFPGKSIHELQRIGRDLWVWNGEKWNRLGPSK